MRTLAGEIGEKARTFVGRTVVHDDDLGCVPIHCAEALEKPGKEGRYVVDRDDQAQRDPVAHRSTAAGCRSSASATRIHTWSTEIAAIDSSGLQSGPACG